MELEQTHLEVENFIDACENIIKDYNRKGLLGRRYFTEQTLPQHEGHSRIMSLLTSVVISLGFYPDIERGIQMKPPMKKRRTINFSTPDIAIINLENKPIVVIEYESPDADIEKILGKIDYFIRWANNDPNLSLFILFYSEMVDKYTGLSDWIREKENKEEEIRGKILNSMMNASKKHFDKNFLLAIIHDDIIEFSHIINTEVVNNRKINISLT